MGKVQPSTEVPTIFFLTRRRAIALKVVYKKAIRNKLASNLRPDLNTLPVLAFWIGKSNQSSLIITGRYHFANTSKVYLFYTPFEYTHRVKSLEIINFLPSETNYVLRIHIYIYLKTKER